MGSENLQSKNKLKKPNLNLSAEEPPPHFLSWYEWKYGLKSVLKFLSHLRHFSPNICGFGWTANCLPWIVDTTKSCPILMSYTSCLLTMPKVAVPALKSTSIAVLPSVSVDSENVPATPVIPGPSCTWGSNQTTLYFMNTNFRAWLCRRRRNIMSLFYKIQHYNIRFNNWVKKRIINKFMVPKKRFSIIPWR